MSKLLSVFLAAALLVAAFASAAAAPPAPDDYRITQAGSCWLPDGNSRPSMVSNPKQSFAWETPLRLVAVCAGHLPRGAALPKETINLDYGVTGRPCRIISKSGTVVSTDYTATVAPNGVSTITCRVDME